MSQLELALKKARDLEAAAEGRLPERVRPESRVASWAFKSAWDFDTANEPEPTPTRVAESRVSIAPVSIAPVRRQPRDQSERFRDFSPAVREKLVVGEEALPEVREQFRKLASALYNLQDRRERKIVMIVSASPGEGKTLTATNFALTLSESYRSRVLLVDADLRRPSVHKLFDITNDAGLKEALSGDTDARLPTVRVSSYLDVLTAGSVNIDPMSALTSDALRSRLSAAARVYDWVVLDTSPVDLLPDAKILAELADAAILVIEAGVTKCEFAQRAVEAIGRERLLGVVLNQLPDDARPGRYRNYHYSDSPEPMIERS